MAVLAVLPYQQFFNPVTGLPLAFGKVFTYAAGTNTPKSAFSDQAGLVPLTNPIQLDAEGMPLSGLAGIRVNIWVDGSYKYVVQDSTNVTVSTTDNVTSYAAGSSDTINITGLTENNAPALDDYVPTYDTSATANRKVPFANIAGLGQPARVASGLTTSNNTTDPTNDIDIAAGYAFDGNGNLRQLTSILTKQLDSTWVAGSGAGGLFTGAKAPNTNYAIWLIRNNTTGAVDAGFDVAGGNNTPSGWTRIARIAWIRTNATAAPNSAILAYQQTGDYFEFKSPINSTATSTTSRVLTTINSPQGLDAIVRVQAFSSAAWVILLQNTYETDIAVQTNGNSSLGGAANVTSSGDFIMKSDANLQIASRSNVNVTTNFNIRGWYDRRGKED